MSNETLIILRHEEPSVMDELPFGTACKVVLGEEFKLFVQVNKHEGEKPNWLFIGTFNDDRLIREEIDFILGNK